MRSLTRSAATAAIIMVLAGCGGVQDKAKVLAGKSRSELSQEAHDQIHSACDTAITAATESVREQGPNASGALQGAISVHLPAQYRSLAGKITKQIDAQAKEQGLTKALSSAAPAVKQHQWHSMAVDVCTQQLLAQFGGLIPPTGN